MLKNLALLALRHYRDPLSWSAIIVAVGTAGHFTVPSAYMAPIESILAGIVSVLFLMADGRKNPNTDPDNGAVSLREPTVQATVQADTAVIVQAKPDDGKPAPTRPGFGPYPN